VKLTINGKKTEVKGVTTVEQLLKSVNPDGARTAVLINDSVVGKTEFKQCLLKEGDHVEILTFAGGG
jgi:sulfur carrier protein